MDKWLDQIGLKGRALESAVKSCEDNFIDDLSLLASLEQDDKNFKEAFPQAIIRSAISKALASDWNAEIRENERGQTIKARAQDQTVDNRCCAEVFYSTHPLI